MEKQTKSNAILSKEESYVVDWQVACLDWNMSQCTVKCAKVHDVNSRIQLFSHPFATTSSTLQKKKSKGKYRRKFTTLSLTQGLLLCLVLCE